MKQRKRTPILERFMLHVMPEPFTGCWLWIAGTSNRGYGNLWDAGRGLTVSAHRWAYEHWRGTIPEGLVIDHLCRVRRCVNPLHLRAVTIDENLKAAGSIAAAAVLSAKTHCIRGHAFDEQNTGRRVSGARRCRACARSQDAERRARTRRL